MKNSTLETDLEYCEKSHNDLIEIRLDKLRDYLTRHTLFDLRAFFDSHHIKPFAFNALEFNQFRGQTRLRGHHEGPAISAARRAT